MLAAKAGAMSKLGYIAAHSAIVLICLGGLLDGDLLIKLQTWTGQKSVFQGQGFISEIPVEHRLSPSNPSFRANLRVSEGTTASSAILSQTGGILIQDLPFAIELKNSSLNTIQRARPSCLPATSSSTTKPMASRRCAGRGKQTV